MDKKEKILNLVSEFIKEKNDTKEWVAGKDWVHYAGPFFDDQEYVNSIASLLDGWLVLNSSGAKFERRLSKIFGKNHGILTNSGSSGNLLMMAALRSKRLYNMPEGTKVLTPIAGFPTTVNPIFQNKFEPVFVDIELGTLNLDLNKTEEILKNDPEIKVITFAHVLGNPPNMDKVMELVKKYNLILLEDCCDALGSTYDNKPLGSFGTMASCSFYPAHHITMGEGGFVCMNDINTERVVRSFRDWGRGCFCVGQANILENGVCGCRFSNWLPSLPNEIFDHKYVYEEIGYNLKPIELQAAMGLAQLDKIEEIGTLRKRNHKRLFEIFSKYSNHFILPKAQEKSNPDWFAFALTVKDGANFTRAEFCQFLESHKIQTRPYFAGNIMLQPAYAGMMDAEKIIKDYPVARKVTTDTLFLGCSPIITLEQLDYIESIVHKFFNK